MIRGMSLTLRVAEPADLPFILELYADPEFGHPSEFTLEQARLRLAAIHEHPTHRVFIALNDGKPVGTFALMAMPSLAGDGAATGLLEDVVVSAGSRGQGVGEWMMRAAMDKAREMGCCKLMLSTAAHRLRAHAFYERVGFTLHGKSFYVEIEGA